MSQRKADSSTSCHLQNMVLLVFNLSSLHARATEGTLKWGEEVLLLTLSQRHNSSTSTNPAHLLILIPTTLYYCC